MHRNNPIGVFDSGVGGLTVVREIRKILPSEDIVYFGDTARVPYGNKTKKTITKFSIENVEFLLRHNVKLVVIACNTSSSLSLGFLKRCFRVPILGVIEPGARRAARVTRNGRIGIIGTKATVESAAYTKEMQRLDPDIRCFSKACPLFVPLVEEGWLRHAITREIAGVYLGELRSKRIDTLILGCTHYPLLKPVLKGILKRDVAIVDSAKEVALEVNEVLREHGLLRSAGRRRRYRFYVSDDPKRFRRLGERFLNMRIDCAMRSSS